MVTLAPYLVADTIEAYETDTIDGDSIAALFGPDELEEGIAFRQSIPADLMALLRDHMAMDGDVAGDDANTLKVRLEYALVITFLYGQHHDCNEYCKYYKNIENPHHKFIPMVHRTHFDGSVSHVTGIVTITADEYNAMRPRVNGEWLRENLPGVAQSMDRFIDKIRQESHGKVIGDFEIVRIPLDLYHARHATNREWLRSSQNGSPLASAPVFLAGDSAIGSPYFQSISLGFDCATKLAGSWPNLIGRSATCSISTSSTCTSSGFASTCAAR